MIRTIIIDDEPNMVEALKLKLTEFCEGIEIIGTGNGIDEGLELIESQQPDLVFLDIEMPFGTGFDLLEKVKVKNFHVVFVTAYDHYALKAIKFSALDYILKPAKISELIEVVEKVKKTNHHYLADQISLLSENLTNNNLDKIMIPSQEGFNFIDTSDIVLIKADGCYSEFHLADASIIVASKTLKYYEDILNKDIFFRIHKSGIINLKHIKSYNNGENNLHLSNNLSIPVSRSVKQSFLEILKNN